MSTTTKKTSTKGIRYTDAQKKEVVDYALSYNAANGRGGQSKAAEKFNISQLTVASWLKASGAPSSKATKAGNGNKAPKAANGEKVAKAANGAKAPKAKKAAGKSKLGSRYSDEQKKDVTDFVSAYNAANGRGGASTASKKFGVSPLTVVAWLKAAGVNGAKKGAKKANGVAKAAKGSKSSSSGGIDAKLSSLLALSKQIAKAESELAGLQAKFNSLKASL